MPQGILAVQSIAIEPWIEHVPPLPYGAPLQSVAIGEVWQDLRAGTRTIVESTVTPLQFCLVVTPRGQPRTRRGTSPGAIEVLEQTLLNGGQKVVAIDSGLAASSVASKAKSCLLQMGLECSPFRVPLFLVAAATAWKYFESAPPIGVQNCSREGRRLEVLSMPRPDLMIATALSPAEYEVIALLAEGKTHAEIARARGRSTRTVANQLASAFRRLGVSGRNQLLHYLVELWRLHGASPRGAANSQRLCQ